MASYDVMGSIAVLKTEGMNKREVDKIVKDLLKRPNIKTVVSKEGKVHGRLRTIKTKFLSGEKNLIALHKESGCVFKLNVEECYFSSRLSNERLEVARKIKKKDSVLVMFSGVGPFSIVAAKIAKPKKIVSIELGKSCNKYAKENIKLNKVEDIVEVIQGDVKKQIPRLKQKFDVIVMARPNLKDSFLLDALKVAKKGTKIIYYGFARIDEIKDMTNNLKEEAKGKIKVLKVKQAGDIAPYKFRYRIEMKVL